MKCWRLLIILVGTLLIRQEAYAEAPPAIPSVDTTAIKNDVKQVIEEGKIAIYQLSTSQWLDKLNRAMGHKGYLGADYLETLNLKKRWFDPQQEKADKWAQKIMDLLQSKDVLTFAGACQLRFDRDNLNEKIIEIITPDLSDEILQQALVEIIVGPSVARLNERVRDITDPRLREAARAAQKGILTDEIRQESDLESPYRLQAVSQRIRLVLLTALQEIERRNEATQSAESTAEGRSPANNQTAGSPRSVFSEEVREVANGVAEGTEPPPETPWQWRVFDTKNYEPIADPLWAAGPARTVTESNVAIGDDIWDLRERFRLVQIKQFLAAHEGLSRRSDRQGDQEILAAAQETQDTLESLRALVRQQVVEILLPLSLLKGHVMGGTALYCSERARDETCRHQLTNTLEAAMNQSPHWRGDITLNTLTLMSAVEQGAVQGGLSAMELQMATTQAVTEQRRLFEAF